MRQLQTRLIGLAATVALAAFTLGTPVLLLAIHATPTPAHFGWTALSSPDDGTVALAVIGLVAWIAWAIFAVSVVLAVGARLRGQRAPRLPGLDIPQLAAGQLVGLAALLFVTLPAVAAPSRAAATPPPAAPTATEASATPTAVNSSPAANTSPAGPARRTEAYTVKRGDSLWKIATERLGDGTRYTELETLNRNILGSQPDFLTPGTILEIPVEEPSGPATTYVVQPGDTLSEIAEAKLGDADDYPEIFKATEATIQPGGRHLTDPNLIRPGWRLTIPANRPGLDHPLAMHREATADPGPIDGTQRTGPDSNAPRTPPPGVAADSEEALPSWVLPGLAGGGAALAGALLIVLRQHRRTQLRFRRPGRIIAPPPPELHRVEKSAHASGSVTAPRIEEFNTAMRNLAEAATPTPGLLTAALGPDSIKVVLTEPSVLPKPWTGETTHWQIALAEIRNEDAGAIAPYPLMVSVGVNNGGALIYLNLEELRTTTLTGETDRATALGRHVAAELALNPWSSLVEIHALGIADELATIDPLRLHHQPSDGAAFLKQLAADLEAEDPSLEPDQYRALLSASTTDTDAVRQVAKIITRHTGRAGAAVLTIGDQATGDDTELHLTTSGNLVAETLDLNLIAAGLTVEEARACAALVDITRDSTDTPVPPIDQEDSSDAAGALAHHLTAPRPADGRAGDASLLPDSVEVYEAKAPVVAADLDSLAPVALPEAEQQIRAEDPALDEDLARWQAATITCPKLTLLGPVNARTAGDVQAVARRKPFYVELLTYLALHPHGVTAPQVADAFGIRIERARNDLSVIRHWLGTNPRTGKPHLPNARAHQNDDHHGGSSIYLVEGLLTDLDLFRRLRARGQSQGADGISDLLTALQLVQGEPFTGLRPSGWGWLLDGDRTDHIATCAIVDVAHIITTRALAEDDLDLARFSAETAYGAAPYDETSRLDLIDVAAATGHSKAAERQLIDNIFNRADDVHGPVELPERTALVTAARTQRSQPRSEK